MEASLRGCSTTSTGFGVCCGVAAATAGVDGGWAGALATICWLLSVDGPGLIAIGATGATVIAVWWDTVFDACGMLEDSTSSSVRSITTGEVSPIFPEETRGLSGTVIGLAAVPRFREKLMGLPEVRRNPEFADSGFSCTVPVPEFLVLPLFAFEFNVAQSRQGHCLDLRLE